MYTRHKAEGIALFIVATVLSYSASVSYEDLANAAITVVSISVAVYIAAMSALLGSPYANHLKAVVDKKIKGKSQLGVLATYLRAAGLCGTITIIISCLYLIPSPVTVSFHIVRVLSSVSCGIFAVNILFLWIIFQFLSVALINSAQGSP